MFHQIIPLIKKLEDIHGIYEYEDGYVNVYIYIYVIYTGSGCCNQIKISGSTTMELFVFYFILSRMS